MSAQRGTPTMIRHHIIGDEIGMVITVSTPSAFTAHFHRYKIHGTGRNSNTGYIASTGSWSAEKGAVDDFDQWVEDNSPHIE